MDNQHRKIDGYRELDQNDIDMINGVKSAGHVLESLLEAVDEHITQLNEEHGIADAEARRWLAIGRTDLQKGLMAITRAVAKPTTF